MRRPTKRLPRIILRPLAVSLIIGIVWCSQTVRLASVETSPPTCVSLAAVRSSDANEYTLTVTAFGGSSPITGYTFDFGDEQSYTFAFTPTSAQNYDKATVNHTYPATGIFTATAHINIKLNGKPTSVSSPGCRTVITMGSANLVNTGAGNTVGLFVAAVLAGLLCHHIWLRRRYRG